MSEDPTNIGWHAIQDLAKILKRPITTLLALSSHNDPFYLGPVQRDAEWFAALYHEHGFRVGVHCAGSTIALSRRKRRSGFPAAAAT